MAVKTVVFVCICNSEVKKLSELEELNVSGNQLTTLPPSLGVLTKLVVLRAHSNSLHSLPNFHDAVSLRVSSDYAFQNNNVISCIFWYFYLGKLFIYRVYKFVLIHISLNVSIVYKELAYYSLYLGL